MTESVVSNAGNQWGIEDTHPLTKKQGVVPPYDAYWWKRDIKANETTPMVDEPDPTQAAFIVDLDKILTETRDLLIEKNRKYGDSALSPSRIFSKSDAVEQIRVRLDDKLTRIKNQQADEDEDVIDDLLGYLIILKIAMLRAEL